MTQREYQERSFCVSLRHGSKNRLLPLPVTLAVRLYWQTRMVRVKKKELQHLSTKDGIILNIMH